MQSVGFEKSIKPNVNYNKAKPIKKQNVQPDALSENKNIQLSPLLDNYKFTFLYFADDPNISSN